MNIILLGVIGYLLWEEFKPVTEQRTNTETYIPPYYAFLDPSQFHGWFYETSPDLKQRLDRFFGRWQNHAGVKPIISPAHGAVGRHLGASISQHNIDKWGEVRAVDVMLPGATRTDLPAAVQLAKSVGFTGIGAYPDWKPYPGLHLDVRKDRTIAMPALWSGIIESGKQVYKSIDKAF